jgi:hypothetical protein
MKKYIPLSLLLQVVILTVPAPHSHAQWAGELIAIEYPSHLEHGDTLKVTMTVENTGTGTWTNLCAFVGYRSSVGSNTVITVDTCHALGDLDPGAVGTFSCALEDGISGMVERIWAGVGAPVG